MESNYRQCMMNSEEPTACETSGETPDGRLSEPAEAEPPQTAPPEKPVPDFFAPSQSRSLQEQFERFRGKRVCKNKQKIELRKQSALKRGDPDFKQKLREKFVETAKQYYGVPYAKRFLKPDHPHYDSKLFLDCCGLVRRVVWDLKVDFGFTLGPFNQNYQFETLPICLGFEELQPGDLIFYEATYYPHMRFRKQIHRLVHVEIFVGGPTGEQSIGARWSKGVVQLHDCYKFVSTNYFDIKYHFRSIDTWLDGICKSYFPKSSFGHTLELDCNKNSLFVDADELEEGELDLPPFTQTVDRLAFVCEEARPVEKYLADL